MTNREFLTAISENGQITDEMREFAQATIEKMDAANEKRRAKSAEKENEILPFITQLVGFLSTEPKTAAMLVEDFNNAGVVEVNGKALSPQRVSSWCRKAMTLNGVVQTEVKVPGKGVQKAYTIAE